MLQKMREQTNSLAFKVVVGAIIVALAVFGFGAINLFGSNDPDAARVNGESITQSELGLEMERERRRLQAQYGEAFDPSQLDLARMQDAVLEQMIARELLVQAIDDLGLSTSDAQVAAMLRRNESFQVEGVFQEERFGLVAQSLGYSPKGFLDNTRLLMTIDQLQRGILGSGIETKREQGDYARLLGQRRDIAYLPFTAARFAGRVEISDDDIEERYEENRADYLTPESATVDLVVLNLNDLMTDSSISVDEAAVRAAYDADRAAAPDGEERSARHILLLINESRDDAAAEAAITAIKARIEGGESFEEIARSDSEDPGSAMAGGELGFVSRGVFDPDFEAALFALGSPGDLSGPVKTTFGYHLIQLEEVRQIEYPEYEVARADVEARLRREQAQALFDERLRELDNLAFERPDDLAGVAKDLGLEVRRQDGVTRAAGPDVFESAKLRDAVFSAEVLERGFNTPAVTIDGDRAVVAHLVELTPASQIPVAEVADAIRATLTDERARSLADEARIAASKRLESGDTTATVATAYGVEWQRFEAARRNESGIPAEISAAAFTLPRPVEGAKALGHVELEDGGSAIITVTRVVDGQTGALTESEQAALARLLSDRNGRLDFGGFFETLERDASISRRE